MTAGGTVLRSRGVPAPRLTVTFIRGRRKKTQRHYCRKQQNHHKIEPFAKPNGMQRGRDKNHKETAAKHHGLAARASPNASNAFTTRSQRTQSLVASNQGSNPTAPKSPHANSPPGRGGPLSDPATPAPAAPPTASIDATLPRASASPCIPALMRQPKPSSMSSAQSRDSSTGDGALGSRHRSGRSG